MTTPTSSSPALRRQSLTYLPYHELGGRPNVIVDGSPTEGTVLCLTHWPGNPGLAQFAADLSAQMAFTYLDAYDRHQPARCASNNHFDQDGLVSLFALVDPDHARARRSLLVEVARAGDFATYTSREAARISMVLAAYADPRRSPLGDLGPDYDVATGHLYGELLGRLVELCDHPERFRPLFAREDASLDASEQALASGAVTVEEVPDVDLAVIGVPDTGKWTGGHRFASEWVDGLHPMAVYNATDRLAVLVVQGQRYRFTYRYESWVQYRTRRPRPRVDLSPLAARLEAEEPGHRRWHADRVSALTPGLSHDGEASDIAPPVLRCLVEEHLRTAAAAWDPYVAEPAPR